MLTISAVTKLASRNKKASVGLSILLLYVMIALFANLITDHKPSKRVARPHQEPSMEHMMGTTRMGRDVYTQFVHGTRTSLAVGFSAGLIIVVLGTVLGISAGYFGGKVDEVINFFTNIALVIPQLPLLLVLAAFPRSVIANHHCAYYRFHQLGLGSSSHPGADHGAVQKRVYPIGRANGRE